MLKGVNLYLIGMMGSGKSTVGRLLAAQLGYGFLDLDQIIEQVSGQSVADIFAEQGEAHFRALETQVLAAVSPYTCKVVATGGGVVLARPNWGYLHYGIVVWLDAPIEVLLKRIEQQPGKRPLLAGGDLRDRLQELLAQRSFLYDEADVWVDASADEPVEVARLTLERLELRLAEDRPAVRDHQKN